MDISLTYTEATTMLADHLRETPLLDSVGFRVSILPQVATAPNDMPRIDFLCDALKLVRRFHPVQEKITAIKALREYFFKRGYNLSLPDAKHTVELLHERY